MTKKRLSSKSYIVTIILMLLCINSSGVLKASEYDFLSFDNISAEKGLEYLSQAKVGDVSRMPNSPTVLVTSSRPADLERAKVIKDLVDCSKDYSIKCIPWIAKEVPSSKQIMSNIGTMTIGDFSNPPAKEGHARTVVDTYEDQIMIIAPSNMIERIADTIDKLQRTTSNDTKGELLLAKADNNKFEPKIISNELNITPSYLAQNVSKNDNDIEYLNQRITDPAPLKADSSYQAKPVESRSDLEAENALLDISSIPNPDGEITLDFPERLTLIEFIGMAGPLLHMDFMYNESDLSSHTVTINPNGVLKGVITIKDVYNYLDTILQFKGLAMVKGRGNLVIIVPKDQVINIDTAIKTPGVVEPGDSVLTRTFKLENISTETAENLIRQMQLGIQIIAIPENKELMIMEYTSRMPRIRALLDVVDKAGEPKKFRYRQLQYTRPQTLVPKVQALAEKMDSVSVTISATTSASIPPRPEKRDGESDASFRNRTNQWDAEVRRLTQEASRRSTTTSSSAAPVDSTVFIDYDERTNRVLMVGLEKQLEQVEGLIDTLDVAQKDPREFRKYKIQHLDAEEVLKKLQDLNIIPATETTRDTSRTSRTGQTSGTRITTSGEPREIVTPSPSPSSGGDGDTLQAVGEEPLAVLVAATNALLINATPEQHARISAVIELVDNLREEIPFKIYQLKNSDPDHILSILEPLIEETIRGPEDKIQETRPKQDEQITIVADPNTSSLIVNANMRNQNWIESLIRVLDKRRPQVLIDVTLVQISKNDAFNYDLNLLSSLPDLTSTSGLTSALLSSTSVNLVEPLADSGSKRSNFLDFQSNGTTGGTGFYGDRHINALLTMIEKKDYGRVMAKPQILVNDNQRGRISTTDTTYVEVKSSSPIGTINTGQQTSVPSYQTEVRFEDYEAGIQLEITPHISESDLLRLDILLKRNDFGTVSGERPPDITGSEVETKVTIPDGSTIILGGMMKMNQSKGGSKVPLLSQIPLLGSLFRSVNNSDIQRNLYVFVKAEIIRPPSEDGTGQVDLERISKRNQEEYEEYEKQFQDYQSFPGIEPTPMIPAKVLDRK